ncbi:MAG: protein kinase domain-containing protein [Planctomycetota bacterium]|jgi:serine/threonine-protein kinase
MCKADRNKDKQPDQEELRPTADYAIPICDPGTQIGHFRIEREIGRGGMGIVYLAHDGKLDRLVAIKTMPAQLWANSVARTRFIREAKLLASLSHPNIGVIHDIIEPAEDSAYLVLEYVPGETLAERMVREPLRLNDALSMGLQIAQAVCAAHEEGVIHRDLKPGNIKITPDGRVKVLDFGLAKISVSKDASGEPTVTQAGRVMGTPAYMSPEQARGKPMDRRTDIWSFGCLLYEMLTGHLPFEGETATDILARIIEREPDWDRLPPTTPSSIRVMLRRCLAKESHRRLQHMGDAVLEIDETLTLPAAESGISEPVYGKTSRPLLWLAAACGCVGLIVGIIATSLFFSRFVNPSRLESNSGSTIRTKIELPDNQVLGFFRSSPLGLRQLAFALSPDGSRLVYVADLADKTQLFLHLMNQDMDQDEVRPIPETDGASSPFFSPDGQSVGFFADEKLKVVSLLGGEPRTICVASFPRATGSWGDDGMIYFTGRGGLSKVPAEGGNSELLLGTESDHLGGQHPQILPGGEAILISSEVGAVLVSLETMEKKLLVEDILYARYLPTGHLVYAQAGVIKAVPFNLATLKVTGSPVLVLEKVLSDSVYGSAQFAISNNGLLVYASGSDTAKTIPTWVDRQGNEESLAMEAQNYGTPKVSPDGKKLAIVVNELQSYVYIYDIATGLGNRLTLEGNNRSPVWTPDGKRVTFGRDGEGEEHSHIFWQPVDGSREAELLYSSQHTLVPSCWSSDGEQLLFAESLPTSMTDIWVLSLEVDREPELKLRTEFREHFAVFSPDGLWMAYMSNKEGKSQVYVQPYPAMDRLIPISYGLGEEPIWSPKGDELFYRSNDKWMAVSISTEPEFKAGAPEVLFEGPYINVGGMSYDVAPDGKRLLVLKPQFDDSQIRELHVVTNWFEELKRLVPTEKE